MNGTEQIRITTEEAQAMSELRSLRGSRSAMSLAETAAALEVSEAEALGLLQEVRFGGMRRSAASLRAGGVRSAMLALAAAVVVWVGIFAVLKVARHRHFHSYAQPASFAPPAAPASFPDLPAPAEAPPAPSVVIVTR